MLQNNKYSFNIIDLLTTVAIVAIISLAAVNLMKAPLPSPQAVTQVLPEDMGDQFLNLMAGRIESDWTELEAIPESPDMETDDRELIYSGTPLFGNSNPIVYFAAPAEEFSWDPRFCKQGMFKIVHTNQQDAVDFAGYIRTWKEMLNKSAVDNEPLLVNLNLELSWPDDLPYGQRSRIYRKVRLVRPNPPLDDHGTLMNLPCGSVWGIEVTDTPKLYYYALTEMDYPFIGMEGQIRNLGVGKVEALTCTSTGIYFIYRTAFDLTAGVYLIPLGQIDGNPDSPLEPTHIGPTGLIGINLSGLHSIDGRLWAVGETAGQIYSVNQLTGNCTEVVDLNLDGMSIGAITMDATHHVLLVANRDGEATVYSFESFPHGEILGVKELAADKPVDCMAAYPDGSLYLYNGSTCWKVDSRTWLTSRKTTFPATLSDMAFFYEHERDYCLNPPMLEREY